MDLFRYLEEKLSALGAATFSGLGFVPSWVGGRFRPIGFTTVFVFLLFPGLICSL